MNEAQILADQIFIAVKSWLHKTVADFITRLEAMEKRLQELPIPKDAPELDVIVAAALQQIHVPKDGRDAPTLEEIVAAIPIPKDGRDAPTLEEIATEAAKHILPGKDGRDAPTLEEIVAAIPVPKNGKDGIDAPTLEEIVRAVEDNLPMTEIVAEVVKHIPIPKDGRDAPTLEEIVSAVPVAKEGRPGRDAPTLEEIVAAIPAPKDGKDAPSLDEIASEIVPVIKDAVAAAVNEIPKPKDGRDAPSLEEIVKSIPQPKDGEDAPTMEDIVAEVIKLIPPPRDGLKGDPGRDALQLDVREEIDKERRYPRGTFASYEGGLIRAVRPTDPIVDSLEAAGWSIVVSGIVSEEEELLDGGRILKRTTTYTGGKKFIREHILKTQINRGIWMTDKEYQSGDVVTWDGAQWCADEDTSKKPGTDDSGWRLIVKRGRDGKDAIPKNGTGGPVRFK